MIRPPSQIERKLFMYRTRNKRSLKTSVSGGRGVRKLKVHHVLANTRYYVIVPIWNPRRVEYCKSRFGGFIYFDKGTYIKNCKKNLIIFISSRSSGFGIRSTRIYIRSTMIYIRSIEMIKVLRTYSNITMKNSKIFLTL